MTTWLVSTQTGADANGGTSISVRSTGTDGIASSAGGLTKFTSIGATWGAGDVGHAIRASSGTLTRLITAVQAAQSIATAVTASGLTTFTSAGLFNATMLGCAVSGPGIAAGTYISAYTNSSSMTLSAAAGAGFGSGAATIGPLLTTTGTTAFTSATGQTWTIGGMKATLNQCMVTASGLKNVIAAGDQIYVGSGTYRETVANAVSGSQLSTTYNGSNGSSLTTLGSVITLTSVTGLVQPPAGYYNQGSVVTSAGVVGFTWTGISGSTLTGVTFLTNNTVTSAATVASSATLLVSTPIWVIGDVDGAQTGQAGQVVHSAFTTNDTTAPSGTVLLAFAATTNLSFGLVTFVGGSTTVFTGTAPSAVRFINFSDCVVNDLSGTGAAFSFTGSTTGLAESFIIDRCIAITAATAAGSVFLAPATTASGTGDFDLLFLVRNCLLISGGTSGNSSCIITSASGTAANSPGGVRCYDSTLLWYGQTGACFMTTPALHTSTTIPCETMNSLLLGTTGLIAGTSGQIVENFNIIACRTTRTNVTAGGSSQTTARAPLLELGQSFKWAMGTVRPFMAPDGASSPLLGFGASANGPQSVDWQNRPRPSGGKSASPSVGYMEFHDFSVQDTTTYPTGQTSSASMTGPGDTDIWVPVDAVSTTIAIQLRQGSGYTGTTYATATIIGQGEIGVASQVQTCASTLSAWQTLTFSAISPSEAGWVKVRISSFDTSGTGVLNFGALTTT